MDGYTRYPTWLDLLPLLAGWQCMLDYLAGRWLFWVKYLAAYAV